jgi:hypothetical protein
MFRKKSTEKAAKNEKVLLSAGPGNLTGHTFSQPSRRKYNRR